jgi:hypothetical protein
MEGFWPVDNYRIIADMKLCSAINIEGFLNSSATLFWGGGKKRFLVAESEVQQE